MRTLILLMVSAFLLLSCRQKEMSTVEPVPYMHWQSNSIQSNGIRLHYWRTGDEGKPAMILAHGITDYGLNWAPLAAEFENEFDIIMYDARGHGFSEKPDGPYSLEMHVQDLIGLIEALEIKKPVLMGHSMGGSTVALAAATYPEAPAAVIMEDPPMEEALENLTEDIIDDWKEWIRTMNTTPKLQLMQQARSEFHPGWNDFIYDHWAESKHLVVPGVVDILQGNGFGNPREIFRKITAPSLILKAEATPELRKRHLEAAALLPNGKLVHFDDAGHVIRNDKPAQVEEEIRGFLQSVLK
jgi:pimeloyl-ACP methyl ester carboxylesterase